MNLVSHRIKNRRVILIIGMGLCGINFVHCFLNSKVEQSRQKHNISVGANIVIEQGAIPGPSIRLKIRTLRKLLEKADIGSIADYSYSTYTFEHYTKTKNGFGFKSISGLTDPGSISGRAQFGYFNDFNNNPKRAISPKHVN